MKKNQLIAMSIIIVALFFNLNCSSSKEGAMEETKEKGAAAENLQIKNSVTKAPRLFVEQEKYIFKDVEEGSYVDHEWELKNIGTDTLYISDVESSCGCTAAAPGKKVIGPNESTTLRIKFDSRGRLGINTKFVTVHSNDSKSPNKVLVIEGRVIQKSQSKNN